MRKKLKLFVVLLLMIPFAGLAQDTTIHKLDSLSKKTDSAGGQVNNITPKAYNEQTKITFKSYFQLLGSNIKQAYTKPFHMTSKDWAKLGKFTLVTVALGFADEPIQRFGLNLRTNSTAVSSTSNYITKFGGLYETYTLAIFGAYGVIFKNEKMKTTTLLATQAYITGAALEGTIKFFSGRTRPSFYAANTEAEPRFVGPLSKRYTNAIGKKVNSSFPSGHTTVAFAAATVFALEYKDKPYIPVIAYSVATVVGLSRITENKHWATDVLVGAALGYLTGKQVVNNYHRYAKLKAPNQKKNTVAFNLDYHFGRLMPGLVYSFK